MTEYDMVKEELGERFQDWLAEEPLYHRLVELERSWRFPGLKESDVTKETWEELTCICCLLVISNLAN